MWQWLPPNPALGSPGNWQRHSLAESAAAVLHQLQFLPCFAHFSTGSTCPSKKAPRGLTDFHGKHAPQMESFLREDEAKVPGTLVLGLLLPLHALAPPSPPKVFISRNPFRTVSLTPCFLILHRSCFLKIFCSINSAQLIPYMFFTFKSIPLSHTMPFWVGITYFRIGYSSMFIISIFHAFATVKELISHLNGSLPLIRKH